MYHCKCNPVCVGFACVGVVRVCVVCVGVVCVGVVVTLTYFYLHPKQIAGVLRNAHNNA